MAITQFSLMGYLLLMPKSFGMRIKSKEEAGIIHFWRVVGRMLGISDRINVCRKSVDETLDLFRMLMDKFSENLNNPPPEYDQLTDVMLDGLWYGNLDLNKEAFLTFIYRLTNVKREVPFGWWSWFNMQYHNILIRLLLVPYIGDVTRVIHNKMILISLYLGQNLSLIAWMLFGKEESQLKLYPRYN